MSNATNRNPPKQPQLVAALDQMPYSDGQTVNNQAIVQRVLEAQESTCPDTCASQDILG